MQVSVESTSSLERRMTVEIPKEKLDQEIQARLKKLAGRAKIQGFRPGKVPMNVIKQRYGGQVQQEAMGELIQSSYFEAVRQENLRPAGMPQIQPLTNNEGSESMSYTATFEVYPEINIQGLDTINIERPQVEITDADIDAMLQTIRKQRKQWKAVERAAADGDRVNIDFEGIMDGTPFEGGAAKNYDLELGAKRMIPGFEDQLVGISAGDNRVLKVSFPDDYHAKDLAGKAVEFNVTCHKVEQAELPELNDEFAKIYGITEGGLEAFRTQVKDNMLREVNAKIRTKIKQQVLDGILQAISIEVPKVLVDSEIKGLIEQQRQSMGLTNTSQQPEFDPKMFEDQARRRVALGLILSEMVKENSLKAEPSKVRQAVEDIAAGYEHPEEVVKYYFSNKDRLAEVESVVLEDEAIEWVVNQAKVTDNSTSFDQLMNLGSAN